MWQSLPAVAEAARRRKSLLQKVRETGSKATCSTEIHPEPETATKGETEMSRRGHGEGSIFRRKDGRWVGIVDHGYRDGKRHRKSIYGGTRKEVSDELKRALRAQQLGLPPESGRLTVGEWLTRWLGTQKPPATKYKTYAAYEYQTRMHLIPAFGKRPISKLDPQEIREFMQSKAQAGLSSKSIRHFRATLRAALNVAVHDGLIARNVAALAKPPSLQRRSLRVFSETEAAQFLGLVKGHRLEALFTAALSLGMREGEILGLRWQDVDLEAGTLQVNQSLQRIKKPGEKKSRLELISLKTQGSRRRIELPEVAVSALRAHQALQKQERKKAGSRWREFGMVFTTSIGTMLDQRNMLRAFYAIMNTPDPNDPDPDPKKKRNLLPRLRFHDLRHSAATLLLAQGVHPRYIMDLLGHSSISLTMNTYGHVLQEMRRETAKQTDEVFNRLAANSAAKSRLETIH
jgi:integrase